MADKKETTALAVKPIAALSFPEMISDKRVIGQLQRILPPNLTVSKMAQVALTLFRTNEYLQKCSPMSILSSLVEVAQLGLELDKSRGQAYLVPFKGECTAIVGYKGFITMALRTNSVSAVWSDVVCEGEPLKILGGTLHQLHHEPGENPSLDEKDWVGVYACIRYNNGYVDYEYLTRGKVMRLRERSMSYKSGRNSPWLTDPAWMWKKSAVRQLMHRTDLAVEDKRQVPIQRAAALDDYKELGLVQRGEQLDTNGQVKGIDAWEPVGETVQREGPRHVSEDETKEAKPETKQPKAETKQAKSETKTAKKETSAERISENQRLDFETMINDFKLTQMDVRRSLDACGHKGTMRDLAPAKAAAFTKELEGRKRLL